MITESANSHIDMSEAKRIGTGSEPPPNGGRPIYTTDEKPNRFRHEITPAVSTREY